MRAEVIIDYVIDEISSPGPLDSSYPHHPPLPLYDVPGKSSGSLIMFSHQIRHCDKNCSHSFECGVAHLAMGHVGVKNAATCVKSITNFWRNAT